MSHKIDRRDFIKTSAAGAVGTSLSLRGTPASARIIGANDRIVAGFVGTGRMGESNLKDFVKQSDVTAAAVCDVYAPNLDKAAAAAPGAQKFTDFRRLLERKDIDVVVVSTPDHWHALPMVMACQSGKDVYVEKPISLTLDEGRKMVQAARKYNRVVQVGTQQRSGLHFQKAVELIRGGAIGKISFVRTWNVGNQHPDGIGNQPDGNPPPGLDWDMWLGPAPKVPFNANRFGVFPERWSSFRWFWDYAGGMVTDWSVHLLDIVQWAMGADYPQTISATGGKFYLQDNRETPDTLLVTFEYPGFICTYENRECNGNAINGKGYGITFHGTDGTLLVDRGGFELIPERRRESQNRVVDRAQPMKVENSNNQHEAHVRNFLDSVKSRQKPICDIETGHRTTSTALLANIAYRSRRRIVWDGKSEQIIGDREASRFLSKSYRKPWTLNV
jgi:predicted dehydrogenase